MLIHVCRRTVQSHTAINNCLLGNLVLEEDLGERNLALLPGTGGELAS